MSLLYLLVNSPLACQFPGLYQELGIEAVRFDSARNLHRALKERRPDYFVGEFVYGWSSNYAGANVSNLDVTQNARGRRTQGKNYHRHAASRETTYRQAARTVRGSGRIDLPHRRKANADGVAEWGVILQEE